MSKSEFEKFSKNILCLYIVPIMKHKITKCYCKKHDIKSVIVYCTNNNKTLSCPLTLYFCESTKQKVCKKLKKINFYLITTKSTESIPDYNTK